ncbi:hypothetical protein JTB14_026586 [Gonioctena quinquepunctata]|nr:hypothetical protein JTB14_026586 [Gonioctena quinquepunctata]
MLQITEDTPPDMLAGAMDLAVHLPTGRTVKMSVERSTPMMDLLVHITTNHHLQLSNYTLQALGMAPSSDHSDKILPYKPNTPIGTLDTQHVKVIPKSRSLPVPKNVPPGHQPFESTFRLKVHLPRNQLYVTRVSRHVLLEDIMKKVCEEKNLDPMKYEFKHPGNLDEALDPKLTLSDYQITEIYVVAKGTVSLSQAISTSDIMALRKEEERKQMHNKTGGGVFNLIFRKGKSSMGSGSISSDTRSISPTHSDDSRSVTPPGVQQQILTPPKKDPPPDRPKPPQRKRRPAPKPPQQPEDSRKNSQESRNDPEVSRRNSEDSRRNSEEKPASTVSEVSELQSRRMENGLVICHSRNSSDSSGYHEASVLSEHCNTSLPRRPKSAFIGSGDMEKLSKLHSHSTTNLAKMSSHSKSTTSLGITGRKKKAAPPPPPALRASNPAINVETLSPVVASPPIATQEGECQKNPKICYNTVKSSSNHETILDAKKGRANGMKLGFRFGKNIKLFNKCIEADESERAAYTPRTAITLGRIYGQKDNDINSNNDNIDLGNTYVDFNGGDVDSCDENINVNDVNIDSHPVTHLRNKTIPDLGVIAESNVGKYHEIGSKTETDNIDDVNTLRSSYNSESADTFKIRDTGSVSSHSNENISLSDDTSEESVSLSSLRSSIHSTIRNDSLKSSRDETGYELQTMPACGKHLSRRSKENNIFPGQSCSFKMDYVDEDWNQFKSKLDKIIISKKLDFL